ncbi:MAG: VWA domain-containing protein [Pyrinomonadaceae bacterium]
MRLYKFFAFLLITVSCFLAVSAQNDDEINVDTSIVRLNIGAVSRSGQPVKNLTKENFSIYEDGVKQDIIRFEPTAAPFSVVMILDMSGSTLGFRQTIQQSAFRFVDALAPNDRIAVIEFYDKVNLLNDFTENRKTVAHSISVANGRGKTKLYSAINLALQKLNGEGNRRKAVIVLTDGVDTDVRNNDRSFLDKVKEENILTAIVPDNSEILSRVISRAGDQGVTIYPLALPTGDPAKLAEPTPVQVAMYSAARARLQTLAKRTGGTLNAINRLEEMGRLYAEVAADIRALYTVEYQPSNEKRDGKWREIKIEINRPELITRTRPGYYAK